MAESPPAAVLAAGGLGSRSQGPTLKQFRPLGDRPLLAWSLRMLLEAGCGPVIVVVPDAWLDEGERIAQGLDRVVVAAGGASRQRSVANGLELVRSRSVIVHDAARPLATTRLVRAVLAALGDADGAVAAVPVDETLKVVDSGRVRATVERAGLWRVQTPQAFDAAALRAAHESAAREGFEATDDAQLIERQGGRVAVVEGSRRNIKITYPEDFELAESLLQPCR